jgi:RNA polymerase sigma-70 factor (ECF subfamily)
MPALDVLAHPMLDPHPQLEARDMLRRLEGAVAKLPLRTREIFLAHRLDGLTYTEIAARTGLSVKGVEKQMSKAIHQVRRVMGPL